MSAGANRCWRAVAPSGSGIARTTARRAVDGVVDLALDRARPPRRLQQLARSARAGRHGAPAPDLPWAGSARCRGCSGRPGAARRLPARPGPRPRGPAPRPRATASCTADGSSRRCARRGCRRRGRARPAARSGPSRIRASSPPSRCSRTSTMSGRPRAAANTSPSWTEPWFIAPSPMETRTTRPSSRAWEAIATPAAIGTPAPTIEFSPSIPQRGANRCGGAAASAVDAARALAHLAQQCVERYAARDRPAVAAVGAEHTVAVAERGDGARPGSPPAPGTGGSIRRSTLPWTAPGCAPRSAGSSPCDGKRQQP